MSLLQLNLAFFVRKEFFSSRAVSRDIPNFEDRHFISSPYESSPSQTIQSKDAPRKECVPEMIRPGSSICASQMLLLVKVFKYKDRTCVSFNCPCRVLVEEKEE